MARRNILLAVSFIKNKYPFMEIIYIDTDGFIVSCDRKRDDQFYSSVEKELNNYFSSIGLDHIKLAKEGEFDNACIMTKKKYILYNRENNNLKKIKATGFVKGQNECVRNCLYYGMNIALQIFNSNASLSVQNIAQVCQFFFSSVFRYFDTLDVEDLTFTIPLNIANNNSNKTNYIKYVVNNLGGEVGTRYNTKAIVKYYECEQQVKNGFKIFRKDKKLIGGYQEIENNYTIDYVYLIKDFLTIIAKILFLGFASKQHLENKSKLQKDFIEYFKNKFEERFAVHVLGNERYENNVEKVTNDLNLSSLENFITYVNQIVK